MAYKGFKKKVTGTIVALAIKQKKMAVALATMMKFPDLRGPKLS